MAEPKPIRILSVEDHAVFREGLSTIIGSQPDMCMVAQAANAEQALAEFRRFRPDITLMDLRLPGTNGTDALVAIRGEFPQARIIMLTTSEGDAEIQRAMRAGASAYLLKSMPKAEILAVIRTVHAGRKHVPAEVAARLAEHLGEEDLTTRELEVLRLIRDGYRNKQIALSWSSVADHAPREPRLLKHIWTRRLLCFLSLLECTSLFGLNTDRSISQFMNTAWTAKDDCA